METGIYAPAERPDDPPGKPRHGPTRQPDPYRQCTRADVPEPGGDQGPAGQSVSAAGRRFEADLETLAAHPHPEDGFAGVEIRGDTLTDKENDGAALLDACKEVKGSEPVQIGSYRGLPCPWSFRHGNRNIRSC